jgi:hypothetical protein
MVVQGFAYNWTMRLPIFLILLLVSSLSTAQSKGKDFLNNLEPFCGKYYGGKAVFPEEDKNPFKGQDLMIYFSSCAKAEVRIPFQVGEDRSRTWVLTLDEKGLLLKHDHRHEDGTPDDITMYGGYANSDGNALEQHFPADAYTANLIPAAATNEWSLVISKDKKQLSYILKRDGQLRFRADFDLRETIRK